MEKATDLIGKDAAILSAVEVGLGSVLHSFKVPLSGHFLSLNQAFLLSRSTSRLRATPAARRASAQISGIAAILKSLSPAGKKLTPMLAISAQGVLFSLGTIVFGPNVVGAATGAMLSSLWAFAQPVLIYYLIFGKTIVHVADYFYEKTKELVAFEREQLLVVLAIILGLKLLLALAAAIGGWLLPEYKIERFQSKMLAAGRVRRQKSLSAAPKKGWRASATLALKDLLNPLFIASMVLTGCFFLVSEAKSSTAIWGLLRPLAVGFLLFFIVRAVSFERVLKWMDGNGLKSFAASFRRAVQVLKQI